MSAMTRPLPAAGEALRRRVERQLDRFVVLTWHVARRHAALGLARVRCGPRSAEADAALAGLARAARVEARCRSRLSRDLDELAEAGGSSAAVAASYAADAAAVAGRHPALAAQPRGTRRARAGEASGVLELSRPA